MGTPWKQVNTTIQEMVEAICPEVVARRRSELAKARATTALHDIFNMGPIQAKMLYEVGDLFSFCEDSGFWRLCHV